MKSLKEISWEVPEETYRKDPAISYSTLAKYEREGFQGLPHLFERVESPSLTFGSAVDAIITGGMKEFNERFFVADYPNISDGIKRVADYMFKTYADAEIPSLNDVPDSVIINAIIARDYQNNWKMETRIRTIRSSCLEYWDMLILSEGKTVIKQSLYEKVLACVTALKASEATRWYFEEDNPFDKTIERLYQLKFKGEYDGIPVRCMMDLVIIDHKNKTIIPVDLKTSSKEEYDFPKSFVGWRYDVQASLYWYILRQNLDMDPYFKDFKLVDYLFIVVNKESLIPMVWEYPYTQTVGDVTLGEYKLRNWRTILKELHYYLNETPAVPLGIDKDGINDIADYFKRNE